MPAHGPLKTPVEELLAFLARPHMLAILYAVAFLLEAPARFQSILELVQASPTTVSRRLKEAVAAGLLERTAHDENPPRVEYVLAARMQELDPAFEILNAWCQRHDLHVADGDA